LIDAECRAKIGARFRLLCFERDTGSVGNPVDRIEQANYPGRISETGQSYRSVQRSAYSRERRLAFTEHGFRECDK